MKVWLSAWIGALLVGCSHPGGTALNEPIQSHQQYDKQFEIWKRQQSPELIREYEVYLKRNLIRAPSLFEVTFNAYSLEGECEQYRFAIPPREEWKNLVTTLKLLEKLKSLGVVDQAKIVSIYRAKEANHCTHDRQYRNHHHNAAIDFQVFNASGQFDETAPRKLCDFWREHGKRYDMGLAIYPNHVIHIDTRGYQTWGSDFSEASSFCAQR